MNPNDAVAVNTCRTPDKRSTQGSLYCLLLGSKAKRLTLQ